MTELQFVSNQVAKATRTQHNGRSYIIVPVVAQKEGVVNKEFVSAEVLGRFPDGWNGRPVVIAHPTDNKGNFISANTPTSKNVGHIWNTKFKDNKLKFEAWLDELTLKTVIGGDELTQRLLSNQQTEGSTAYFRDYTETPGDFNGTPYDGTATGIVPDHYAFLLNEQGACSVADGCGGPRVNTDQQNEQTNLVTAFITALKNYFGKEEETTMTKDERITALVANKGCNLTKEVLDGLDESALATLHSDFMAMEETETPETPPAIEAVTDLESIQATVGKFQAVVDDVMAEIKEFRAERDTDNQKKVDTLAEKLAQNQSAFSLEDLKKMTPEQLGKLEMLQTPANYEGRGLAVYQESGDWVPYEEALAAEQNGGVK